MTYFKIEIPRGTDEYGEKEYDDKWNSKTAPPGLKITLSFAEPFETVSGEYDVTEEDKEIRTIAIDRTRKSRFIISKDNEKSPSLPTLPKPDRTSSSPSRPIR